MTSLDDAPPPLAFAERMTAAIRSGQARGYRRAMEVLCAAEGKEAELLRRILERARLPIPRAVVEAAIHQRALFNEPRVDRARFFVVAA